MANLPINALPAQSADYPANSHKITGLSAGTASGDAASVANNAPSILQFGWGSVTKAGTSFLGTGYGVGGALGEVAFYLCPFAGTIKNLRMNCTAGTNDGTGTVYTLRKNAADTAVTISAAAQATSGNDLTHSFTVAAGDKISLSVVDGTVTTAPTNVVCTCELIPSV